MRSELPLLIGFSIFLSVFLNGGASLVFAKGPVDVCQLPTDAQISIRDKAIEDAGKSYSKTTGAFSLSGAVCNMTCGLGALTGRKRCMDRLEHLASYNCYKDDSQQGRAVTDQQYYEDAEARWAGKGGPLLQAPDWFVNASTTGTNGSEDATVESLTAELRKRGVKYLDFSSSSIDNDGKGFRRVLVLLEGDKFDQWIQIATTSDGKLLSRNIDFIAVEKKDPANGAELITPNLFFKGYSRTPRDHSFVPEGLGSAYTLSRCYSCHSSGLRTVVPDKSKTAIAFPPNALDYFQGLMARTPMNLGIAPVAGKLPSYDPELNGPPMGANITPTGEVRGVEQRIVFLGGNRCAKGLSGSSQARVAKAMNCAFCHSGHLGERGVLNAGTDLSTIRHKIAGSSAHIPDRALMPPPGRVLDLGQDLSTQEKAVLVDCLRAEYTQDLKSWLKVTSCSTPDLPCPPDQSQKSAQPLDGTSGEKLIKAVGGSQ